MLYYLNIGIYKIESDSPYYYYYFCSMYHIFICNIIGPYLKIISLTHLTKYFLISNFDEAEKLSLF